VWVNYVWQQHFGRGLVATSGDFGVRGAPPTHPELLDWLATEFRRGGWSTKQLHRLVVLSSTYRQSSEIRAGNERLDPENKYLWRWTPRRLEAEAIRDAVLSVSGDIDLTMRGPSVPPEEEVGTPRRSLYLRQKRDDFPPMQNLFDGPSAHESCPRRYVSTVALQSLYGMNNPFMLKEAGSFATRVFREAGDDETSQIEVAFTLALSRKPESADFEDANLFLRSRQAIATSPSREALAVSSEATATEPLGHFPKTGEKPEMVPKLPLGLVHLCHALLNLNEFVYLE
jgi:Protein of unknown function (DUF1553)